MGERGERGERGKRLQRWRDRARVLWLAVLEERASPREIAVAVGAGVFVGVSPAVGFHGGLAVAMATLLRVNRLYCFVGSRVSNPLIGPWLLIAQIQTAHRLRTGAWLSLTVETVLARGHQLLIDWFLGMFTVGVPLSITLGGAAYVWAARRALRAKT